MISALVPVKNFSAGKSRLAPALCPAQREILSAFMLGSVLRVLQESGRFAWVFVVTHDVRVAQIGQDYEARVIWEPEPTNENQAIWYATEICRALGVESLLVLPADIPFLTVQDVAAILSGTTQEPKVTLCPSKEGTGTNALLRTPPDVIPARFGPNSFSLHRLEAEARKIPCEIYPLPRVALDIDRPEDLFALRRADEYSRALAKFAQSTLI